MRALILGGTGAIGGAVAAQLADAGWSVEVTGRNPALMPPELVAAGVRFQRIERHQVQEIDHLVGDGVDLLLDAVAYTAADVLALLPVMARAVSLVLVSSAGVYADPQGRHVNGEQPPWFPGPIGEDTATVEPAGNDVDPLSRAGYAPCKVAAERAALDSGLPVTVLRPAKVHGPWARNPRTRSFVEAMLSGQASIALADRGASVNQLSAAANTAALIEVVARTPGRRVLNSADPDAPNASQIVGAIGEHLGWEGHLELLEAAADPASGDHPWRSTHPRVLETTASQQLGYRPVAGALELLTREVDWVAQQIRAR